MTVVAISLTEPHVEEHPQDQERFLRCHHFATHLLGGYVKKIIWDEAGGFPEHSWGYVQFSPRPFRQGYGCDGTTDENVHLIAATLCQKLGLDYARLYRDAYPDDAGNAEDWITALLQDESLRAETLIPNEAGLDEWVLLLSDLSEINNHSLVGVLTSRLTSLGYAVDECSNEVDRLCAWRDAIDGAESS